MGVIPMKEEDGVQEIYTRGHGVVRVRGNSWQDGRHHIVLSPNGAYQHMSGLPIKDEEEIHAAFGRDEKGRCPNEDAKQKCLNWFRNRHEQAGAPRPIQMHPDGHPVFEDGTIPDFDDLYAYFRPGKGLTGMIVALQDYLDKGDKSTAAELKAPETPVAPTSGGHLTDAQAQEDALKAKERIEAMKEKAEMKKARIKQAKTRAQNLKHRASIKATHARQKAEKEAAKAAKAAQAQAPAQE